MHKNSPKLINAAGGVVFRFVSNRIEPEVLIIFRNGVWDLPKGKTEEGETIEMSSVREVAEEVGSHLPTVVSELGTTYHEYSQGGIYFGKTTHWYSMIFTRDEDLVPQQEEGIEKVEWVPLTKAMDMVGFQNLKDVLQTFRNKKRRDQ